MQVSLIEALNEVIDARFASQREAFQAITPARPGLDIAGSTLYAMFGSGDKIKSRSYVRGPSWPVARAVVEICCAEDTRWVLELGRIVGLWVQANDGQRPSGYDGPFFPVTPVPTTDELVGIVRCPAGQG